MNVEAGKDAIRRTVIVLSSGVAMDINHTIGRMRRCAILLIGCWIHLIVSRRPLSGLEHSLGRRPTIGKTDI
jgi:hypothetical protein